MCLLANQEREKNGTYLTPKIEKYPPQNIINKKQIQLNSVKDEGEGSVCNLSALP